MTPNPKLLPLAVTAPLHDTMGNRPWHRPPATGRGPSDDRPGVGNGCRVGTCRRSGEESEEAAEPILPAEHRRPSWTSY